MSIQQLPNYVCHLFVIKSTVISHKCQGLHRSIQCCRKWFLIDGRSRKLSSDIVMPNLASFSAPVSVSVSVRPRCAGPTRVLWKRPVPSVSGSLLSIIAATSHKQIINLSLCSWLAFSINRLLSRAEVECPVWWEFNGVQIVRFNHIIAAVYLYTIIFW